MAKGIKKGDIVEIELDNLAHGGESVGRLKGLAIFVPGGIPGERVRVRITESKKSYARGELLKVLRPVEERIDPACPVFAACGGCQLQQMDYPLQLSHKRRMVEDLLERLGGLKGVKVNPVIGADYPWGYRNKAQFPLTVDEEGKIVAGFYRKGTHEVVVHNDCSIQHPLINRILKETIVVLNQYPLTVYDEKEHTGLLRHLVIWAGICTNQAILTIVTSRNRFPHREEIAQQLLDRVPELTGILQNINPGRTNVILGKRTELIDGEDYYLDYVGSIRYAISPESFFQVNTLQTEKLYSTILEYAGLTGKELVVDAYCGIGSIALYIAGRAGRVFGIEEVFGAIEDAKRNAELNNITNCTFQVGKVEEKLPELLAQGIRPDLVIFDPPRKGLAESVIDTVLTTRPDRLIYVSCNSATLARDLALLQESYRICRVQPVDMFPQTYHVETVVLLEKIWEGES